MVLYDDFLVGCHMTVSETHFIPLLSLFFEKKNRRVLDTAIEQLNTSLFYCTHQVSPFMLLFYVLLVLGKNMYIFIAVETFVYLFFLLAFTFGCLQVI